MKRVNDSIALYLSAAFSTMTCFWAFLGLALLPLIVPRLMPEVQFISSGVLQLIALPLIAVAGKIIQDQQAAHAAEIAALHDKHDAVADFHEQHAADLAALHLKHDELHDHIKGRPDASSE
ncbi:MAG: hypothetical protein KGL63_09495 [Betaproteobacteria bacterium]|nr:hypothetical protein [Betaproteobacteria bacterium]